MSDPDLRPEATDHPWSPFPVQDWEALARERAAAAAPVPPMPPAPPMPPMPPAPPIDRPHRWIPPVVIALVTCLIAGALFVGDRVGRPATSSVADYVPADGTSWVGQRQVRAAAVGPVSTTVTESALIDGTAISGAVDFQLGGSLLADTGSNAAARSRYWRLTTTSLDHRTPPGPPSRRDTQVYRVGTELTLVGESGDGRSFRYTPGLVELPRGVTANTSWESHGRAGTGVSYTARSQAAAAPSGCLVVTTDITYTTGAGQLSRQIAKTWCRGQGITEETDRSGSSETTTQRVGAPPPSQVDPADPPSVWTPASWQPHELLGTTLDPIAGRSPMPGTPSAVTPVMTGSGALIRVSVSGQDLSAFTPGDANDWVLRWRGHPGGLVLTLTAFGNVVVATTADRRVVGYDDQGVRLWEVGLTEVVLKPPTRASASELAFVALDGEVVLAKLASGEVTWRAHPGADVGVGLAVSQGVVAVADRAGNLIGLAADSGRRLWRSDIDSTQFLSSIGGVLVVVSSGDIYGVDIRTGSHLWRASYSGAERGVQSFAGWVVLLRVGGAVAFDAAGHQVWSSADVHALTAQGEYLVRWGRARADVVDSNGREVASFSTPEETVANTQSFVGGPDGVYQLDSSWRFRGWTGA